MLNVRNVIAIYIEEQKLNMVKKNIFIIAVHM